MNADSSRDNLKAIGLMVLAMVLFGIDDAGIKLASGFGQGAIGSGEVILIKGIMGTLVYGAMMLREPVIREPGYWPAILTDKAVLTRTFGDLLAVIGMIVGLSVMPLSNLSAILQVQPLLITLGAALILREAVGWRRWSAILVGLVGVLIIIRPGMAGFEAGTHWALLAVIGLVARDLSTRRVNWRYSTFSIVTLVTAMMIPLGLAVHGVMESRPLFSGVGLPALALIMGGACLGIAGYWSITVAARIGEASAIAPYRYSRLVVALMLGFLMFGEIPDTAMIIGTVLVIGAGLFTLYRERKLKKRAVVSARPS